ncbi:hypothetical protein SF83666_c29120 [Sinorhizobium fredii CCBAU 83666]|nr:hypothetical protein SF83666_c29120 [Sinorhizobium fredii CCBAU 83666]
MTLNAAHDTAKAGADAAEERNLANLPDCSEPLCNDLAHPHNNYAFSR